GKGVSAVRRGAWAAVERPRRGGDETAALLPGALTRAMRSLPAGLVEKAPGETLRIGGPDDRRPARAEPDPHPLARAIDDHGEAGDRDRHRVPRAHEHVGLRRTRFVPLRGHDELIRSAHALLRAG